MPMIGCCNSNSIDLLTFEQLPYVLYTLRFLARNLFDLGGCLCDNLAVDVTDIGHLNIGKLRQHGGQEVAPAVGSHYPHNYLLVRRTLKTEYIRHRHHSGG